MAVDISERPAGSGGGFLRWWFDELGAALLRRARRPTAPRRGFLLLPLAGGGAVEVLRRGAGRGRRQPPPRELGVLELPDAVVPDVLTDGAVLTAATVPPEIQDQRLATMLRRGREPVVLVAEAGDALLCEDLLPAGAEADLDRIMPHRIDLLTPWGADRVHAGYRLVEREADGALRVLLASIPREIVDPVLSRVQALGIAVDGVDVRREDGTLAGLNLLGGTRFGRRSRWKVAGWLLATLLAVAIVGGAALAGRDYLGLRDTLETQRRLAAALDGRLADVPALRARIEGLRRQAGFVAERQGEAPSPLVVLEVLSRILPDSIWLDQVALDGRELTLSGYAEDAAQVLPIVEGSAHFEEAEFRTPSTRVTVAGPGGGRREVERFSLSALAVPLSEPEP